MYRSTVFRLIVAMIGIGTILAVGCSDDITVSQRDIAPIGVPLPQLTAEAVEPLGLDLPAGAVRITGLSKSADRTVTQLSMEVAFDGEPQVARFLTIDIRKATNETPSFDITLADSDGSMLWTFVCAVDKSQKGSFFLREVTPGDDQTITHVQAADHFDETYELNGESRTFHFPTSDPEHVSELHEALLTGDLSGVVRTPTDSMIVATLRDFDAYYDTSNTLHNNREGFLIVQVLGSEEVIDWLSPRLPEGGRDQSLYMTWEQFCELAAVCAMVKCPFAAINPACGACGTVVVICAVVKLSTMIW